MKKWVLFLLMVLLGTASALGQTTAQPAKKDPALEPIQDDPKLPRVLLIGDSISIGYTVPTRKLLQGKANVHRILTNGGPTITGVEKIDSWLGKEKWDVIHFNWGLHDIKLDGNNKHQVGIEDYEKNLKLLVKKMQATGATLIWCSTTPVPEGKVSPARQPADVVKYNEVAKKIMEAEKIAIHDLYNFALPKLSKMQRPVNVHFTEEGSAQLAESVAKQLETALALRKKK